jgi:hypothetical protein
LQLALGFESGRKAQPAPKAGVLEGEGDADAEKPGLGVGDGVGVGEGLGQVSSFTVKPSTITTLAPSPASARPAGPARSALPAGPTVLPDAAPHRPATTLVRALPSTAIARMHQLLVSEMSSPQRG